MTEEIILDFFGEEICVPIQKDLFSIRNIISTKFCLSISDAKEILLYFIKDNKKIIINKEEEYATFLKEKIKKIFLDISQSSQIYQKNLEELKKNEILEKLEILYKKREELQTLKKTKYEKEIKEMHEIRKEIKKMRFEIKKIKMKVNLGKKKIKILYICQKKGPIPLLKY